MSYICTMVPDVLSHMVWQQRTRTPRHPTRHGEDGNMPARMVT